MRHKIRDCIIWLIALLGIAFLYRAYVRTKGPLVRAIVFHDVKKAQWFEDVIKMLTESYAIITPEQFHSKEFNTKKINILLTFDDGYQSWIDVCLPVLTKYNYKGLFFINSGLLEVAGDEVQTAHYMKTYLHLLPKRALTWEGAKTLITNGHTIGGHTVTHQNIAILETRVRNDEIKKDKMSIEFNLGSNVSDFAYPFGRKKNRNAEALQQIISNGYTHVYTADAGFYSGANTEIPRLCIEKDQKLSHIDRWIQGAYDIFSSVSQ